MVGNPHREAAIPTSGQVDARIIIHGTFIIGPAAGTPGARRLHQSIKSRIRDRDLLMTTTEVDEKAEDRKARLGDRLHPEPYHSG